MKKRVLIISWFLMSLSLTAYGAEGNELGDTRTQSRMLPDAGLLVIIEGYLCGDINGSGDLTMGDAFQLLNYFGSTGTIYDMRVADINGDGSLTTGDGFELMGWFGSTGRLCCTAPDCLNCDPSPPCP
jgi:hypothetical protein